MNILGIVAEYNPFHNGHLYQLQQAKKISQADYVIAIMSGHFTQRGEPAILPKETRTQLALKNGIDLVLELPTLFATSSAEYFASNAVYLLHQTNTITHLAFGMEEQNLLPLTKLAACLSEETPEFQLCLKKHLKNGFSYPKAREKAVEEAYGINFCLNTPNNILGIEYLKALKKLNSPIQAVGIQRISSPYHQKTIHAPIASATAIRQATASGQWGQLQKALPETTYPLYKEAIEKRGVPLLDDYAPLFHYQFYQDKNTAIQGAHKDLTQRLYASLEKNYHLTSLLQDIKTKRYTYTMLQRYILHTILQITNEKTKRYHMQLPYIRILGFRKKSAPLLKILIQNAGLPVIGNLKHAPETDHIQKLLQDEFFYSHLYDIPAMEKKGLQSKREPSRPLVIL